jgi:hypothetical protein
MANKKGLFGILNDGNGAGVGVDLANPGTTLGSAVDNTVASPAFVDNTGVLTFPQLNSDGTIPVQIGAGGTCISAFAKVTGSTSFQDLGTIVATIGKTYSAIEFTAAAMTEACIQLVYVDDVAGTPTETVLSEVMVGPGQYTASINMACLQVDTTGGTGTQHIKLKGLLLEATGAEIAGTIAAKESA